MDRKESGGAGGNGVGWVTMGREKGVDGGKGEKKGEPREYGGGWIKVSRVDRKKRETGEIGGKKVGFTGNGGGRMGR